MVKDIHLQIIFVYIAIITGIILITIVPPLQIPDENTHFYNAYTIADGQFFPIVSENRLGKFIKPSVRDFVNSSNVAFVGLDTEKQNFKRFYFDSHIPIDVHEKKVFTSYFGQEINPVSYLFASLGIMFGKIVLPARFESPYNLLLWGRLFNLFFYIFASYFTLKIIPYYKSLIFLILLMPMSIFLAASLSYDTVIIPVVFLLFAVFFKIYDSKRVNIKDVILTCIITFFLVSVKLAYAPLLLVLFALPISFFSSKRNYFKIIGIIVCVILFAGSIHLYIRYLSKNIYIEPNANVILQKNYIKENYFRIIPIILNTLKESKIFYFFGIFGILGQLDTNFPVTFICLFYCITLFIIFIENTGKRFLIVYRILAFLGVLMFFLGLSYKMYTEWTPLILPVKGKIITGIQGRYFIPILPFLFSIFAVPMGNKLYKVKGYLPTIAVLNGVVFCLLTILMVLLKFW